MSSIEAWSPPEFEEEKQVRPYLVTEETDEHTLEEETSLSVGQGFENYEQADLESAPVIADEVSVDTDDDIEPTDEELAVEEAYSAGHTTDTLKFIAEGAGKTELLRGSLAEKALAQQMEAGQKASADYQLLEASGAFFGEYGELADQTKTRLEDVIRKGQQARNLMIEANQRLVMSVAKGYNNKGVPPTDLFQEGTLGLMRAVDKFDWRKGYKLSTYATWWIRQACQRAVANQSRTIRIPVHVHERQRKIYATAHRLEVELGREPTEEELQDETGIDQRHIDEATSLIEASVSLNQKISSDNDSELGDVYEDRTAPDTFEAGEMSVRNKVLYAAIRQLPERERKVLAMHFGLAGETKSLDQIGGELHITRERVRQIESQALRRLADILDPKDLGDDVSRKLEPLG